MMSVLSILTPAERRFFEEAVRRAEAKQALEDVNESALQEQQEPHSHEEQTQPQESQHFAPPCDGVCSNSTKPADAIARYSGLSRQEYDLWERVERSLEFLFVYRSEASKSLCYRMLRRVPLLRTLSEGDLETISSHMEVLRLGGAEVLARKPSLPDVHARQSLLSCTTALQSQSDDNQSSLDLTTGYPSTSTSSKSHHLSEDSVGRSNNKQATENRVFILIRGRVTLRIPSLQSAIDAYVEPYEVFALPLMMEALPDGSWYETEGDCMLISLTYEVDFSLDRVIGRLEKTVIETRVSFLRQQLRVKVFTYWTPEQYESCARALVPLRLSWRQVVVDQGMESDAMYFIYEGQCVVVCEVSLQRDKQETKLHSQHTHHNQDTTSKCTKKLSSYSRRVSPQGPSEATHAKTPSHPVKLPSTGATSSFVKSMEIVTLREGEFFGELGILNHQVDWKPDVDTVWSKDYWQKTLDRALRAPVDFSSLEGDLPWRSKNTGNVNSDDYNGGKSENRDGEVFPPVPLPRQATVYTKSPCVLLMLSYESCRRLFADREYAQLKEFAKGYPSSEDIREQYERQRRWAHYRKTLVDAVMKDSRSAKRKIPTLPPLHFH